jgi:uncharacterized protein (TIGR02246 family)
MHMRCWTAIAALSAVAAPLQAAGSREQAVRLVIAQCVRAWDKSDAAGIAAEFEPDADFVSPDGIRAVGSRSVKSFYAQAFADGYAHSRGMFDIHSIRFLNSTLAVADGQWSIADAHDRQGKMRAPERGLAVAVLRKHSNGWKIVALREQSSATKFQDM